MEVDKSAEKWARYYHRWGSPQWTRMIEHHHDAPAEVFYRNFCNARKQQFVYGAIGFASLLFAVAVCLSAGVAAVFPFAFGLHEFEMVENWSIRESLNLRWMLERIDELSIKQIKVESKRVEVKHD